MTYDALLSLLDFHYRARDGTLDAVERLAPEVQLSSDVISRRTRCGI